MVDFSILKAPHHLDNRIHFTDVTEKLIAHPLPLGGAGDKSRNVHKLHRSGNNFRGLLDLGEGLKAGIGHGDHAHVGVDGAKGIIG